MPISPVIPSTVEVRLLWTFAGQGGINVLHGIVGTGFVANQSVTNTLATAIKGAVTANLATLMPANCSLVRVGLRDLRTPNQAEFIDANAAVVGSAVTDPLPPQTSLCVTLRTALSGKSFRGRVYLGGFSEATSDVVGTANSATSTAAVAFLTAVSNAMTASQITFAVASRPAERYTVVRTTFHNDGTTSTKTITQGPARPGVSTAVSLIAARNATWETQRRRMNGRSAPATLLTAVAQQAIGPSPTA